MAYIKLAPKEVRNYIEEKAAEWHNYARDDRGGRRVCLDYTFNGNFRVYTMTEEQATSHSGFTPVYKGESTILAIQAFNQA